MSALFDLPHLISDVIADVQPTADDKGVHVAAHHMAAMPQWVEGDEPAVRRMLLNTLDLVVGAATDGAVTLRLDTHDSGPNRWMCVIEWQGDREDAIVEVQSTFVVTLCPADLGDTAGPLRILVVDDSAQHRTMVSALLSASPHAVTEADSGEDAIRRVGAGVFDVILMDVHMPGMGGIEAIGVIRAYESTLQQPPAYIVALSTVGASDDEAQSALAGADECLPKPLGRDALFRALSAAPAVRSSEQPSPEPQSAEPRCFSAAAVLDADVFSREGLRPSQLLSLARYKVGEILMGPAGSQLERLRLLGCQLKTSAAELGLEDIAHLAAALEESSARNGLSDAQNSARTLQAWLVRMPA